MTVGHAMITRKRNINHGTLPNGAVDDPRPRHRLTEPDDRYLRRIDNAIQGFHPALSETGHRDCGIGDLRTADAAGTRALYEVTHATHQFGERQLIRIV